MISRVTYPPVVWVLSVVLVVALVLAFAVAPLLPALGLVALAVALYCISAPEKALATSFWVFVLLPVGYVGLPLLLGRYLTPAVLILALFYARYGSPFNHLAQRVPGQVRRIVVVSVTATILLLSGALSVDRRLSISWLVVFGVCVLLPVLAGSCSDRDLWKPVRKAFFYGGLFLGVATALDYFFGFNPWTLVYTSEVDERVWSVFRAKASLGHPLALTSVSSVFAMVCLFSATRTRSWLSVAGLIGSLTAIALAASRTGVYAVAAGVIVGLLGLAFSKRSSNRGLFRGLLLAGPVFIAILFSPLLAIRTGTEESVKSSTYREDIFNVVTSYISSRPFLGYGPGTSADLIQSQTGLILENSGLQLLMSVGILGSAAIGSLVVCVIYDSWRQGRPEIGAALTSLIVCLAGYNALDSNPAILVIGGTLVAAMYSRTSLAADSTDLAMDVPASRADPSSKPGRHSRESETSGGKTVK